MAGSLVAPAAAFAQTSTSTPPFRQGIREERKELREEVKEKRMEIRDSVREKTDEIREDLHMRLKNLRGTATTTPTVRHEMIDEMRKRMEAAKSTFSYNAVTRQGLKNSLIFSEDETNKRIAAGENYVIRLTGTGINAFINRY